MYDAIVLKVNVNKLSRCHVNHSWGIILCMIRWTSCISATWYWKLTHSSCPSAGQAASRWEVTKQDAPLYQCQRRMLLHPVFELDPAFKMRPKFNLLSQSRTAAEGKIQGLIRQEAMGCASGDVVFTCGEEAICLKWKSGTRHRRSKWGHKDLRGWKVTEGRSLFSSKNWRPVRCLTL